MNSTEIFFTKLESALPPVFTREEAARHLGGLLSAKTLNNIDYKGEGPEVRVRVGKRLAMSVRHLFSGYDNMVFIGAD